MTNDTLLYAGSIVITLWGIAHVVPTKSIVNNFGSILEDNKRILTMEWIAEGLTLCFIGLLVAFVTIFNGSQNPIAITVYTISALMLIIMAGLTLFTGAKTSKAPIKICPVVKITVSVLFLLGSIL